jgi:hypothetical protein
MRPVELAHQRGGSDPPGDHVDAQRAAAGPDRGGGALLGRQEIAGVRQERLPVDRELDAARGPGEQPHAQVLLQCGDPPGHGLLGDRQVGGGLGELPGVRDGHEGAHRLEVHATRP